MKEQLERLQNALHQREADLRRARHRRDQGILQAHQEGLSMYRIAQIIGISQQAVRHIIKANTKQ